MKKLFILFLFISMSLGVSAQWRVCRANRDILGSSGYSKGEINIAKGDYCGYKKNRNGTIDLYCVYAEGQVYSAEHYPSKYINYLQFTDFYIAEITDPVDDYVNVRRGKGTNYPIVGQLEVGQFCFVKDLDNNWVKIYDYTEDLRGYDSVGSDFNPYHKGIVFKGYVHKSRIKSPKPDWVND